ncbi:MAG TPA: gluconate 2-dehydrogenase subunit 3 family protein [Bryobacteraceae bacterium]|nr:gluconate 2-dehydrogenase subunit 3 family protein [Bryobacteraceae bacterium]
MSNRSALLNKREPDFKSQTPFPSSKMAGNTDILYRSMAKRRHFLRVLASSVGGTLVYTLDRTPFRLLAQEQLQESRTVRIPLRFFSEHEALIIAAAADRIFPTDESGPGAHEANVIIYIDRQLAGPYGRDRFRYTQPPFEDGTPEQGFQGQATPRDSYREGIAKLGPQFPSLPAQTQDRMLQDIEQTRFFRLLRQHVLEGMFSDPMHGGNADLIGWQLIGFPGPYMSWASEMGQHDGTPFRPKPMSLAQVVGRPVKPWDGDEP